MEQGLSTGTKVLIFVGVLAMASATGYLIYKDYEEKKLIKDTADNNTVTGKSGVAANIDEEKRKEQLFNTISEKIIGTQPWGKFYGIMRKAAEVGEGKIKHQICIARDGREIEVAKTFGGKVVKSLIRPSHEYAAKAFGQKKYGESVINLLGFGWIPNLVRQKRAVCAVITPNDFITEANRRGLK